MSTTKRTRKTRTDRILAILLAAHPATRTTAEIEAELRKSRDKGSERTPLYCAVSATVSGLRKKGLVRHEERGDGTRYAFGLTKLGRARAGGGK